MQLSDRPWTKRYVAVLPTCFGIRRVTPQSFIAAGRVTTVVAGGADASVGIFVIFGVAMRVRSLRRPGLARFTGLRYRHVADVLTSSRCRVANLHA